MAMQNPISINVSQRVTPTAIRLSSGNGMQSTTTLGIKILMPNFFYGTVKDSLETITNSRRSPAKKPTLKKSSMLQGVGGNYPGLIGSRSLGVNHDQGTVASPFMVSGPTNGCSTDKFKDTLLDFINLFEKAVSQVKMAVHDDDRSRLHHHLGVICSPSNSVGNNILLQSLLASPEIWEFCSSFPRGREALVYMLDARVSELSRLQKPVFNWEQPNAVFAVDHPEIQQFLRSGEEFLRYSSPLFTSLAKARNFVRWNFSSTSTRNGYSATASVRGKGADVSCEIIKTQTLFEESLNRYLSFQSEMISLNNKRKFLKPELSVDAAVTPPAKRQKIIE